MKEDKAMTRRGFLKVAGVGGAGLVGVHLFGLAGFEKLFAQTIADIPVVWIQAGSCTGCSVSVLNSVSPTIQDMLLGEVVPGKHLSMAFHPNVSAGQGQQVVDVLKKYGSGKGGKFVLVVEGGISTKDDGIYCEVGEENGHGITVYEHLLNLSRHALAVVNVGTCSAYGGIPAAEPNPTGIKPVQAVLKEHSITTPVVNVPGCPPHPDWFVGTVATILIGGLSALDVDKHGRPKAFYGGKIHDNCQLRGQFDQGKFAKRFSDEGCLYKLGCKGPVTYSDCSHRKWNAGENWCIGAGSPCIGCTEPEFPYKKTMYRPVEIHEPTSPETYPPVVAERDNGTMTGVTGVVGAVVGTAVGVGLATRRNKKNGESDGADETSAPEQQKEA